MVRCCGLGKIGLPLRVYVHPYDWLVNNQVREFDTSAQKRAEFQANSQSLGNQQRRRSNPAAIDCDPAHVRSQLIPGNRDAIDVHAHAQLSLGQLNRFAADVIREDARMKEDISRGSEDKKRRKHEPNRPANCP